MKKHLFGFVAFVLIFVTGCSCEKDEGVIRVMTLNIRYDNPRDSINAWPQRAGQVCDFILNENPDIIGMQEVLWHQYSLLDSVLADYGTAGVGREDGVRAGEFNPVFFRKDKFDLARTITFWLSETPDVPGSKGWGASLPRIVTWMELVRKDTHEHFFVFNTHFAHDSDSARIMSSEILMNEVSKITGGFPFIITGDFNMLPDSRGYAILTGPDESVPLMRDAYFISDTKPAGPSYTFNGFSDEQGSGRIDYIFVSKSVKVLKHRTVIHRKGPVFLSDHWPVEANLRIN